MAGWATPEHENGGENIGFQTNCGKGEEVVVKVVGKTPSDKLIRPTPNEPPSGAASPWSNLSLVALASP